MSTKAGTMGFSGRPALFTFWTITVTVLAAAALILSAVALNVAGRGDRSVTSVEGSGTREAVRAVCSQRPFGSKGPHRCGTRASCKPWRAVCSPGSSICSFGRFLDPDGDTRGGRPASRAAPFACIFVGGA
jgi:hypothetical protein